MKSFKDLLLTEEDCKINEFSPETKAWLEGIRVQKEERQAFDVAGTQNSEYAADYECEEEDCDEAFDVAGTQNSEYADDND